MTVQDYVNDVLCVPVSKKGNILIVEAMEIVLDQHTHKFYPTLTEVTGKTTRELEDPIRSAKMAGWKAMDQKLKKEAFFTEGKAPTNTKYIVHAVGHYRRYYQ